MTAKEATGADGGSIYLVEDDRCSLSFALILNDTLGLHPARIRKRSVCSPARSTPRRLSQSPLRGDALRAGAESGAARRCFSAAGFDFPPRERSIRPWLPLALLPRVPMIDHSGEVDRGSALVNARSHYGGVSRQRTRRFVEALTSLAAIALDKQRLIERREALFESLVRLINDAIDEKAPTRAGTAGVSRAGDDDCRGGTPR